MEYGKIVRGEFISRPNRFIAYVSIDGKTEVCHVKNTGRCKELLTPGAMVILSEADNPNRKTKYDLIAVYKGSILINMDSQAPNKVAGEFLPDFIDNLRVLRPEFTYGASRFDFYGETDSEKIFIEVKGVTLERDGAVFFPDAPTERGLKHIKGLMEAHDDGYRAIVLFIIQMRHADYFSPNSETQPEFAEYLKKAKKSGVEIYALCCDVSEKTITTADFVPVVL